MHENKKNEPRKISIVLFTPARLIESQSKGKFLFVPKKMSALPWQSVPLYRLLYKSLTRKMLLS